MRDILLLLVVALTAGKAAAWCGAKIGLPSVVGEIFAGLVLSNIGLASFGSRLADSTFLRELSEIGIILMLFVVGLESVLPQLVKTGARAFVVALVGVVAPFLLTLVAWRFGFVSDLLPNGARSIAVPIFMGATMTATSVGVTSRILQDEGRLGSYTGQIILNAAVIDDVLGLLVLAAVSSFVATASVSFASLGNILLRALVFFAIVVPIGIFVFPRLIGYCEKWGRSLLATGLIACLGFSWLSAIFGLAPIVGGFFAGLFLDDRQDRMRRAVEPIVEFLAPLFFVLIGAQVRLNAVGFGGRAVATLVLLLVLAVLGKMLCALVAGRKADRIAVGLGMAARGEVGLIFAATGKEMGVLSDQLFGTLVFVILLTTLLPAIALGKWLARGSHGAKMEGA